MAISTENLNNWFSYHTPSESNMPKYAALRQAARTFASVIVENTPSSADQTAAIRKVREAVQTANASIACCGR